MIGGVTRLDGLPCLPGRVTLLAGETCQGGVTCLAGVAFMAKSSRNMYVLKLCKVPSRLMAEITGNRNGHTRSVKFSHFGIFNVVNRPYLVSQTIPYNLFSQRFLAKPNTACVTQRVNKYIHVRELIFRLFRGRR